jgi:hypothetical protein
MSLVRKPGFERTAVASILLAVFLASALALSSRQRVMAQSHGQGSAANSDLDSQLDPYQRSGKIYYHKLMGKSGVERGQHIYYLKCWICHNEYAIESDAKNAAPTLKGLYARTQLRSGKPVNDENVKAKIADGGAGMPSYRHTLNETDLADLVTYLREKCCWDADNPPPNPAYKGN